MPSLTDLTIPEALSALRRGETSSRELTQAYLVRIERLEPHLHTFLASLQSWPSPGPMKPTSSGLPGVPIPPSLTLPCSVFQP